MQITIVEHGELGSRLARALALEHRVHLLLSQEPTREAEGIDSTLQEEAALDRCLTHSTGLTVTDSIPEAVRHADHIIFTSPVEYGGLHERYNALICEATVADAVTYNATATIAIHTLVPPGFSDRLAREYGLHRTVHASLMHGVNSARGSRLTLGGPSPEARAHAKILQRALGGQYRGHMISRKESEAVALLAAKLDLAAPNAIQRVAQYAHQLGLNHRVLVRCLGLMAAVSTSARNNQGHTRPSPLNGLTLRAH